MANYDIGWRGASSSGDQRGCSGLRLSVRALASISILVILGVSAAADPSGSADAMARVLKASGETQTGMELTDRVLDSLMELRPKGPDSAGNRHGSLLKSVPRSEKISWRRF